ncbi:MAG: hypothetical protein B6D36_00675 [Planctomycetes bacterium UTPLA1]|nr:MAG: hypothetical protein B6D36_00675 [Planctomycetes bacterium UTPLA1]
MSEASDMVNYLKDQAAVAAGGALSEALQLANQESASLRAGTYALGALIPTVPAANVPTLPPPPGASTLAVDFDAALAQVRGVVDALSGSWLMQYFPAAMPDGFDPLMDLVLNGAIVSDAMQEIMWERAKAQTARDAARFEGEVVSQWASRGFSLPGGVINKQIQRKNQDLFFANADLAAQQTIKALELQVDAAKFAADVGTKLRLGLIDGLTRLVSVYAQLPVAAANYAAAVAEAKRAAYTAIGEYYRAVIAASDITLKPAIINAELMQRYVGDLVQVSGTAMGHQVHAAAAGTNALAQVGAASLSGLNGIASVVNQTIA